MQSENDRPSNDSCIPSFSAIGDALYAIGGKWKLRIIVALFAGNKRFNDIQQTVAGISAKVLSKELKELELNGFVTRIINEQNRIVTKYQLTEYSRSLKKVVHALDEWGQIHRKRIMRYKTKTE